MPDTPQDVPGDRSRASTRDLALAASVLILIAGVVVWRSGVLSDGSDGVGGVRDAVSIVSPTGDVPADQPIVLTWRAVLRAVRYDIEVIASGGALVYGTGVTDTATAVPATFLKPGVAYRWRVTAELPDGRRVGSAAQAFRVRAT